MFYFLHVLSMDEIAHEIQCFLSKITGKKIIIITKCLIHEFNCFNKDDLNQKLTDAWPYNFGQEKECDNEFLKFIERWKNKNDFFYMFNHKPIFDEFTPYSHKLLIAKCN